MLQRLASANELADLSDLSRLLFEAKARLLSVTDSLQQHVARSREPEPPPPRRSTQQQQQQHVGFYEAPVSDGARLPPIHSNRATGHHGQPPHNEPSRAAPAKAGGAPAAGAGGRAAARGNLRSDAAPPSRLPKPSSASVRKPAAKVGGRAFS